MEKKLIKYKKWNRVRHCCLCCVVVAVVAVVAAHLDSFLKLLESFVLNVSISQVNVWMCLSTFFQVAESSENFFSSFRDLKITIQTGF
jgi:hypothetical protein